MAQIDTTIIKIAQILPNFTQSGPAWFKIVNLDEIYRILTINQLDDDKKNALIKIINSMLTKKRLKDLLDGKVKL